MFQVYKGRVLFHENKLNVPFSDEELSSTQSIQLFIPNSITTTVSKETYIQRGGTGTVVCSTYIAMF